MKNAANVVGATSEQTGPNQIEETLNLFLKDLGGRILFHRKAGGMSQQALADSADLDRTYISAVEHGKQNVTVGAIVKLSIALKVPLNQLLVGTSS
jgi:ribosome-binding protein aMBF1 (putative translation factor)